MDTRGIIVAFVLIAIAVGLYSVRWAKREVSGRRRAILAGIRIAFLLALLILWYRPTVARTQSEERPPRVAVILDDSDSMTLQDAPGPDGSLVTRAQWVNQQVFDARAGLIKRLADAGAQVTLHAMSDARPLKDASAYRPNQSRSDITRAIREIGGPDRTSRPAAFVLVTDGADTETGAPADRISKDIPVHIVGIGDASPQVDVRLDELSLPSVVFRNEPVRGSISVARQGGAPDEFVVKIAVDGVEALTQSEKFDEGASRISVPYELLFDEIGDKTVVFTVSTTAPEKFLRNNEKTETVSVLKEKRRVVGLFGSPSLDSKFLMRSLMEDVRLNVQPLLLLPGGRVVDPSQTLNKVVTREDLWALISKADLVIASDLGDSGLTVDDAARLYSYVNEKGGNLLWLGGERGFGPAIADSMLSRIFPFTVPRKPQAVSGSWSVLATDAGARSPGVEIISRVGETSLAPLSRILDVGAVNPGCDVLLRAVAESGRAPEEAGLPLLVTQRYGLGRMAAFLGSGAWAWQMASASLPESDLRSRVYTRFWQGIANSLFMGTASGDLRIETNGTVFEVHEPVSAWIHLDEQAAGWFKEPLLPAELLRPDGQSVRISLSRRGPEQPLYEERFTLPLPGVYTLNVSLGDRSGARRLTARASGQEYALLNQRSDVLKDISEKTGGRYTSAENWTTTLDTMELEPVRVSRRSHTFAGQLPEVVILVLGMAVTEWILRRRWSLP